MNCSEPHRICTWTALLALIQPIEAASLPALGAALLSLERGDTLAAISGRSEATCASIPGAVRLPKATRPFGESGPMPPVSC